jgi:plasmid stabilization system protein ParE
MKPIFSVLASRQMLTIYERIALDNVSAAVGVVARIIEAAEFVAEHPKAGHATVRRGLRAISTAPHPYVVYFRYLPAKKRVRIVQFATVRDGGPRCRKRLQRFGAEIVRRSNS